jgi:transcriptional regulator with XRE-family HTH domain
MIGDRIRVRRNELGLSLRALAKEVNLTASFLSQLERDQADPSIKSLRKIADAMRVPLFYFLAEETEVDPVVRKDRRKRLQLPGSKVVCELLTPSVGGMMQVFTVTVSPDRGNIAQRLTEPTEECIVLIEGRLCVKLSDTEYELSPGDSIYFEGANLQAIAAVGDEDAVFISAMTPAVF